MEVSILKRDQHFGYLLTIPGLATLSIIIIFPVAFTIITSFYDYTLLHPNFDQFVVLEKYHEILEEE